MRKMMTQGLALTILFISATAGIADHACTDCHTTTAPSINDLAQPLSALCADCHAERIIAGEHKVNVPVSAPANTLPLHDGVISCVTCHDPHRPFAALRMDDPELCQQCHVK